MIEKIKTYEELVMGRIAKAFEAMDSSDESLFDEILDEIEMIFKLIPDLGEEFVKRKEYLIKLAQESYLKSEEKIQKMEDEYMRQIQKEIDNSTISWDYRKDLLESALKILGKYNMIPFSNPVFADIETAEIQELEEEKPVETEVVQEESKPEEPMPVVNPKKKIKFKIRKGNVSKE